MLYYKGTQKRPRPSQLLPALLPPVPVPGHASWPSGHATQAWLMALCAEYVLAGPAPPGFAGTTESGPGGSNYASTGANAGTLDLGTFSANLRTLARRIARNREIAGLHYPTDSDAGRQLAAAIFPILTGMVANPNTFFGKAVSLAQAEWP